MTFETPEQAIEFVKQHQKVSNWVKVARENHTVLNALVNGVKFHDVLINRIEKIESSDRAIARKKYSKDIRDLFDRVMQPRISVFSAFGGSVHSDLNESKEKELAKTLKEFKGQKSLKKYLSENFFQLTDVDPNGVIFLEYVEDKDIYPTYKSIDDIRTYTSNGQLCEVLLFEPKPKGDYLEWRLVDDKTDYRIKQSGTTFSIIEDKTFAHPFGTVPACILSDKQKIGSEIRISPIFPIEELSKDYARDKSIKTIYKFQHGFPRHWRYVSHCRPCNGTGKTGETTCASCDGKGEIHKNDVTDVTTLKLPTRDEDIIVAPNVEGFTTPDLETWERYNEDLKDAEELIDASMWGTKRLTNATNETATGRFIDVQPVINKLGIFTDNVEWVHNKLIEWTESWLNGQPLDGQDFIVVYGRRYIIESPDVILDKYEKARASGLNNTILDKLMDEYILSKYQNDAVMLMSMQKKRLVEPYIHYTIEQVNTIFGNAEAETKQLFNDFWEGVDILKPVDVIKEEFKLYAIDNTKLIAIPLPGDVDGVVVTGDERPDLEAEAKAKLKGSVGGVQGILAIQQGVAGGSTDYEAGIVTLMEIYGFDDKTARKLLGKKPTSKEIDNKKNSNNNNRF